MMQNQILVSEHTDPLAFHPEPAADQFSTGFQAEGAAKSAGSQRGENVIDMWIAAKPLPAARRATFILIGGLCICLALIVSAAAFATVYFL